MRLRLLFAVSAITMFGQNPVTDAVKTSYGRIRQNLIETAEVVPESDYSFKLTPAQRTFGEWIEHTAMSAYTFCSGIKGATPPAAAESLHDMKTKAQLSQALKESFEYCDAVLKETDDRKASAEITVRDRKIYPITPMIGLVGSLNEHYGNLVGYMRSRGITPPSTARAKKK